MSAPRTRSNSEPRRYVTKVGMAVTLAHCAVSLFSSTSTFTKTAFAANSFASFSNGP